MKGVQIRPANFDDLKELTSFEKGLIDAERPFDTTIARGIERYYDLSDFIQQEDAYLVVALFEGKIIGSGYAQKRKARTYLDHDYYAHFGFMFTAEAYRGQGINQMILNELKLWASQKRLNEIRLTVYPNNLSAVKAYQKSGFEPHLLEMRLRVDS